MIKVNTMTGVATRSGVPTNLHGLSKHTLNNLQSELNPVPNDLFNIEYWNENVTPQEVTSSQKLGTETLTVNTSTHQVDVSYTILDKTAEELASETAEAAASVRSHRAAMLSVTDWAASTDVTMSTAMTTYRQALRDVPAQEGFPYTIVWPEEVSS